MQPRSIYMVASENGALPSAKAGGVGDVLRDLPRALAARGHRVTVIIPAYGHLHTLPGMQMQGVLSVPFAGMTHAVRWYRNTDEYRVQHIVLEQPLFDPAGDGSVYFDDGPARPFATDATKFALLSSAAGQWLMECADEHALLHAHDWHAAMLLVLRAFAPAFAQLQRWPAVMTLHNLALQGIRPIDDDESSFMQWFPELGSALPALADPRYDDVVNPMAAGIRLADRVNTVSPTNALEIRQPNDPGRGFRGGEGLELLLQDAHADGRLFGILNGCDYNGEHGRISWQDFLPQALETLTDWRARQPQLGSVHELARASLAAFNTPPDLLLTSVGRITEQKVGLLLYRDEHGRTTLERLLATLPKRGLIVMLGSGDPLMEQELVDIAQRDRRLVFMRGFSEPLADAVFRAGELFLMPSTFEPCGISQMLAMRAGQPCLVHAVGGLNDTVEHGHNGFSFSGTSTAQQAARCVATLQLAQRVYFDDPEHWNSIVEAAGANRFLWSTAACRYERDLYAIDE